MQKYLLPSNKHKIVNINGLIKIGFYFVVYVIKYRVLENEYFGVPEGNQMIFISENYNSSNFKRYEKSTQNTSI